MSFRDAPKILLLGIAAAAPQPLCAQGVPLAIEDMPLAQYGAVARGGTVTPVYEGWYEKSDGTLVLYFGYFNRNTEEVVEIPVGPGNSVEGLSSPDAGQPTTFYPGRTWGAFGVEVPADFGERTVVWSLTVNGRTVAIPGHLRPDWMVPAISGDVMGNLPPMLRFDDGEEEAFGPAGLWTTPREAAVDEPVTLSVWASDDGTRARQFGRGSAPAAPVTIAWLKHRGPGDISFESTSATVPNAGGLAATRVTFSEPGAYVVRVRATDDSGVASAGYEQCCWTNGFVAFTVRP
jgi:hypothetical protein